jgi:hypothetical protein
MTFPKPIFANLEKCSVLSADFSHIASQTLDDVWEVRIEIH